MRVFKIVFIRIIVSMFLVGQAYSAPNGNAVSHAHNIKVKLGYVNH